MMKFSRREFGRLALAGVPATLLVKPGSTILSAADKPNSKWNGVQVGMNVPYNFGTGNYTSGDDILARCVQLGVSAVELRSQPVEMAMGAPRQTAAAELRAWRLAAAGAGAAA